MGGEAWGCDAEWATSLEFDLGAIPAGSPVLAAVPPRLAVDGEGAVAAEASAWSALKAAWR